MNQAPVTSGRSIFLTSKSDTMLTAFIVWVIGALLAGILLEGNYECLRDRYSVCTIEHRFWKFIILSCFSVVTVACILAFLILNYKESKRWEFPWQFPTGKHYVELEKPIAHVGLALLVLAGVGCFLLIHGINTYCILSNISIFIIVLVSFFAAIHPIKAAKRLFWTILALVGPMTLDFILHLTITTNF